LQSPKKFAWWAAMRPQLKVRLRCKACHAEERAAFAPRLQLRNSATAAPQNQLHLANRIRRKIAVVGCDATTAKS